MTIPEIAKQAAYPTLDQWNDLPLDERRRVSLTEFQAVAVAVAVLTALRQDAYENGRLMAACIEKRLAECAPTPVGEPRPLCPICGKATTTSQLLQEGSCCDCAPAPFAEDDEQPAAPVTPEPPPEVEKAEDELRFQIQRWCSNTAKWGEVKDSIDALIAAVRAERDTLTGP